MFGQKESETEKEKISNSRILVVGAGGIGCEVLKNLVLSNFRNITLIDRDTVEFSNLNRQFLFTVNDQGKSKAQVAVAAVKKMSMISLLQVTPIYAAVETLNVDRFKEFNVVIGALDNIDGRHYTNEMCITANVPLVDCGSAGTAGQVKIYTKENGCFDCSPTPPPITYPYCTITRNPSQFVHCVIWAKYVMNGLFNKENKLSDVVKDEDDLRYEGLSLFNNKPRELFEKLFIEDIKLITASSTTRVCPLEFPMEQHVEINNTLPQ